MIQTNQMAELVVGMDEFKMDANTQEQCIQQLEAMLDPPYAPGIQTAYQLHAPTYLHNARNTPGLARSIISAVRAHPTNMVIQLGGVKLFSRIVTTFTGLLNIPYVTRNLTDYSIATLMASVNQNMHSPELASCCLIALCQLVEMHSAANHVADPPFLTSGAHSIPGFAMTLMHLNPANDILVFRSMRLMQTLLVNAQLPQNVAGLLVFDVGKAEEHIVTSMPLVIPYARNGCICLDVLTSLYRIFPLRVRRPTDVMACILRNLMAHGDDPDVRESALVLMSTVVAGFWSRTAPVRVLAHGQTRPCVKDMMPLVVCSLRVADVQQQVSKRDCSTFFDILSMLCEYHPHQIAVLNEMQIVLLLAYKYDRPIANGVDGVWQTAYDRLQGILAAG